MACAAVVLLAHGATVAASDVPADRFVAALGADASVPAEARELIRETWAKCNGCDGAEFLAQGLSVLSSKFREGLAAYDAGEYEQCAAIMSGLRQGRDRFLALNAAVYEVKALTALDHIFDAGERVEALLADGAADLDAHTYHGAEIVFLRGVYLLADLQYEAAAAALTGFLNDRPDASQRLVVAAQQILAELATRQPGRIGEVVDLMQFSGRRLSGLESGEIVQTRQQRILDLLDQLIKQAEQNEQSSSSSSSDSSGGGGSRSSRSPKNPMQQSMLPGGAGSGQSLREGRRANPAEMWGAMPPGERERILQALRDSFPSRYRQLVEQYYEELAKKP
ncbi:MAG: hypothetical protein HY763_17035 [Planctomycetes bacterium]|nr:hypothetical protein [Planctomycetota bacterium]